MMQDKLYIIGRKFGSGYPEGRYVCTKLTSKVHDHFFVKMVLDYPSVRAVANNEAWSNAEVYPYGKLFSWLMNEMSRQPEEYKGTVTGLDEEDYQLSLVGAIEREIEAYEAKGDEEAVERLREKLREAVEALEVRKVAV